MKPTERAWRIGRDFAGVLPRAHAAVAGPGDWNPLSRRGARQLGEVVLDELALTGMTLTAPPPKLDQPGVEAPVVSAGTARVSVGIDEMVLPVITLTGWDRLPERSRQLCLTPTDRVWAAIDAIGALEVFG